LFRVLHLIIDDARNYNLLGKIGIIGYLNSIRVTVIVILNAPAPEIVYKTF
jgi:hypothetical protein